jgi:hypothetical protein
VSTARAVQGPITDVETAARRVLERVGLPIHERATVATLESEGLRDSDAASIAAGCEDLFALGHVVHARALELSEAAATLAAPALSTPARPRSHWRRIMRTYALGIGYSLPLIALGLGVLVFGISIWGSPQLSSPAKSGMALGVLISLVASGPFTYAMTRRIFYYWYQYDPRALARTVARWTLAAVGCGALCALVAIVWATLAGSATGFTVAIAGVLLLQGPIWTCTSALYVIGRAWVGGVCLVVPIVPLWFALRAGALPLPAHLVALAVADALLIGATWWSLTQLPARSVPARDPLPAPLMALSVGGFAAWGAVYYLLLFGDRLVAWVTPSGTQFAPGYETALDLALVPLVFAMPILEFTLIRVAEHMEQLQDGSGLADLEQLGLRIQHVLVRTVGAALALYAGIAILVLALCRTTDRLLPDHAGAAVQHGAGWTALMTAVIAYGFLILGLGIGTVFQLVSRPWMLVRAGAVGVVVNLAVGAIARQGHGPQAAAVGLVAGTAAFALMMLFTWRACRPKIAQWWAAT